MVFKLDSFIFDFEKSPTFFKKWNKEFDVENLGSGTFNIVLVGEECPNNIEDCLNGTALQSFSNALTESVDLVFDEIDRDTFSIKVDGDVVFDIGEDNNFSLKAAFLTSSNTTSNYVMGFSINQNSINVSNEVIFEDGLVFWSVAEGDTHV